MQRLDNKSLGTRGEEIATEFLWSCGYSILGQNVRTRTGELDIVAEKNDTYHFIEVKTRSSNRYGAPEDAVSQRKIDRISDMAHEYLEAKQHDISWQIDIIAVDCLSSGTFRDIRHIANIS